MRKQEWGSSFQLPSCCTVSHPLSSHFLPIKNGKWWWLWETRRDAARSTGVQYQECRILDPLCHWWAVSLGKSHGLSEPPLTPLWNWLVVLANLQGLSTKVKMSLTLRLCNSTFSSHWSLTPFVSPNWTVTSGFKEIYYIQCQTEAMIIETK